MASYEETIASLREEWDRGLLSPWNYVARLRPLLSDENIDRIAAGLPATVLTELRTVAASLGGETVEVGRGRRETDAPNLATVLRRWSSPDPSLAAFFGEMFADLHEGRARDNSGELLMLHAEWTNGEIDAAECRRRVEAL